MNDRLGAFLAEDSIKSFAFGERDCLLRLADWGIVLSGRDAGAPWRGRCSSALSAARILKREGGLIAVMEKAFTAIGFVRTIQPARGDVAIVNTVEGEMGGIVLSAGNPVMVSLTSPAAGANRIRVAPVLAAWRWPAA